MSIPNEVRVREIEERIRRTICETHNSNGTMTVKDASLKMISNIFSICC
jgi:hypothetical protein